MSALVPISRLLTTPCDRHRLIAFGPDCDVERRDLERDVRGLLARLGAHGGARWLVFSENAYALAVGLLAGLQNARCSVLPANLQPGHLADLATRVDGVLAHDAMNEAAERTIAILDGLAPQTETAFQGVDDEASEVVLHTSGTSGEPLAITKPLRCLEAEIEALETAFGGATGGPVLATVPPYHIYGLLFRVLWPLSAGRPFAAGTIRFPEELEAVLERWPGASLVTSPAFLKRALSVLDLSRLRAGLGAVFCSGGPLPPDVAASYNAALGSPIVEVYGSTETGGIGYRSARGTTASVPWRPLPGVRVSVDSATGTLAVRSPFVPGTLPFTTADSATVNPDGSFMLGGRVDRIVKLEERRVSLAEAERRLASRREIAACRVVPVRSPTNGRQSLAAIVVPTAEGWAALAREGKPALKRELRQALAAYLDAMALQRRWRFVRQMPENALGKTTDAALVELFAPGRGHRTEPLVVSRELGEGRAHLRLCAPRDLVYFNGHFDLAPILPGVVQVGWALRFAREALGVNQPLKRIDGLKFFHVIMPEQEIRLDLSSSAEGRAVRFQFTAGETVCSSGRLVLDATA